MPAPTISNSNTTTATKFGGDALNNVNKYLNGVDVTSLIGTPIIRTPTKIPSDILKFTNPAETKIVTVKVPSGLSADRSINLVPTNVTDNDEILYKDSVQTVTGKVISAASNTLSNIDTSNLSGSTNILTTTNTKTMTTKTINRTDNTIPYTSPYAFSIYKDGGNVKLVTNATGAVTSYSTLGPAIDAVLANTLDPSAEVHTGFYNLASGFTGWVVPKLTDIKIHANAYINVPQGYNSKVWKLNPTDTVVYNVTIDGGIYDEQGVPTNLWDVIGIEPISTNAPTTVGAVYDCEFKNMFIFKCNRPIYLHTTNGSWINSNRFVSIYTDGGAVLGAEFEHTGTYTSGLSGMSGNYFECVDGQATAAGSGYPLSLYGFKNVIGQFNMFVDCKPWDLTGNGASAHGMTIGANAYATMIIGGIVDDWQFVDAGTKTSVNAWEGIQHNNTATFGGTTTFSGTTTFTSPFTVNKTAEASTAETLFSMGVSDASGDSFTLDNGNNTDGRFNPIFRATITSAAQNVNSNALWLQGVISDANNGTSAEPIVIIGGKTNTNGLITNNKPIVAIYNQFGSIGSFYADRLDMKGNKLINVSEIAQNPLNKRWGSVQAGYGTAVGTVGVLDGLAQGFTPTGAGSNTASFDTTEGKVTNYQTSSASGVVAGLLSSTAGGGLGRRLFAGRMIARFKLDSTTSARFYFGLTSATALPISDTPLAVGDSGIIVGFTSADTNYQIRTNDGATSVTTTAMTGSIAKTTAATGFHTIEINWTASGNYNVIYDGTSQTISTDLPATTVDLYPNLMVQTSAVVQRTLTLKGLWLEVDK